MIYYINIWSFLLNTLASSRFWGFWKKHRNARGFAWEFLLFGK